MFNKAFLRLRLLTLQEYFIKQSFCHYAGFFGNVVEHHEICGCNLNISSAVMSVYTYAYIYQNLCLSICLFF